MSAPRIVLYGTGQYGLEAVRIAAERGWPVVAAFNRAGEKVGRDLGELAGIGYSGVVVQDCATADVGAVAADVAINAVSDRLAVNLPAYERMFGAGLDVICHGGESYFPQAVDPALAERIDALAKANGVTFTGTGIWDHSRLWSGLLAAGAASRIDRLVHRTLTDAQSAGVALAKVCGVSLTTAEYAEGNMAAIGGMYRTVPHHVLHAMGLTVAEVTERIEPVLADHPVHTHLFGDLAPGVVLGTRIVTVVTTREGIVAQSINELRVLEHEESEHMLWEVEGRPAMKVRVDRTDPVHSSATCMVNRIPDVIAAVPGIRLVSELGPMRFPLGTIRR